jgi:hypothetical protein
MLVDLDGTHDTASPIETHMPPGLWQVDVYSRQHTIVPNWGNAAGQGVFDLAGEAVITATNVASTEPYVTVRESVDLSTLSGALKWSEPAAPPAKTFTITVIRNSQTVYSKQISAALANNTWIEFHLAEFINSFPLVSGDLIYYRLGSYVAGGTVLTIRHAIQLVEPAAAMFRMDGDAWTEYIEGTHFILIRTGRQEWGRRLSTSQSTEAIQPGGASGGLWQVVRVEARRLGDG